MIPATHGGLRYGSCPHCAQQPEHCLDHETCALCRCDFCEGRRRFVVLVCGGRDVGDQRMVWDALDGLHADRRITRIVHGDARGADCLASAWAMSRRVPQDRYPADWKRHGRVAGPIRNAAMLAKSRPDLCVAFPGGRGTTDMVGRCRAACVPVLLAGGAAGFTGGADILLGHLERGSKRDDGGAVGLRLAVDQVGDRVGAQSSRLAPCAETALLNHGPEQFAQGLDGGSLCHAGTLSGIGERKLETALDKTVGSDESAQVKNAPDAANLGGASAPGAEPRT